MSQIEEDLKFAQVKDWLSQEENLESLLYLIDKLPDMAKTVQTIDEALTFTQNTLNDKESMHILFQEAESKLEANNLKIDTLHAQLRMFQLLPTVVPLLEKFIDISTFVKETVQDKESMESLSNEMPSVTSFFDESFSVLKETNRRYNGEQQLPNVSIFKLLYLLKDPTIRKGYQYINTMLDVLSEKKRYQ